MVAKVFLDPCPLCIKGAPGTERRKPKQKRCKGHAGDAIVIGERRVDVFLAEEKVTPSGEGATITTGESVNETHLTP